MADSSVSYDPSLIALNSDAASDAGSKATVAGSDASDAASAAAAVSSALSSHSSNAGVHPVITTAAWSKTIGSGGDYGTWTAMRSAMPDMLKHDVTITIETGTTLTTQCDMSFVNAFAGGVGITVQAEEYFPQSGAIPQASSGGLYSLTDSSQSWTTDRFEDCWVLIVAGTGTDNGFVQITGNDSTSLDVALWPGTQPDSTSRYIIVGALINTSGAPNSYGMYAQGCNVPLTVQGIGFQSNPAAGFLFQFASSYPYLKYCGFFGTGDEGIRVSSGPRAVAYGCGVVYCNQDNAAAQAGIKFDGINYGTIALCGLDYNYQYGIRIEYGYCAVANNFGANNGTWGTYAVNNGQANCTGTECSGSSGNHSDPGTAGSNSSDQASAW